MILNPETGKVYVSQFPGGDGVSIKDLSSEPNRTLNFEDTLASEGGPPDANYLVDVPNMEAFSKAAAAERNKKSWDILPGEDETNCSVAASNSLRAGGVKIGPTFTPAQAEHSIKTGLLKKGNGVWVNPSSSEQTLRRPQFTGPKY